MAVALALIMSGVVATVRLPAPATTKPNVVVFLLDDVTADVVPHTPTLMPYLQSRVTDPADDWITFSNAFLNTPICCPTRATLFSGRYSHNTGVETNAQGSAFDDTSSLATWMHDAGYFTGLVGKYFNLYPFGRDFYVPPGWDHWSGFSQTVPDGAGGYFDYDVFTDDVRDAEPGVVEHFGSDASDYNVDVIASKVSDFIDTAPTDSPFYLHVAPKAWHQPSTPAPRYAGVLTGMAPVRKPNFNEADVSDKPAWLRQIPKLTSTQIAQQDEIRRRAYETVMAADDALETVIEALERRALLDNTVVIVTSDNGIAFGEHRWKTKKCAYEECIRAPLFMRVPGATSRSDTRLVSSVDIAATVAALADTPPGLPADGRNLMPLFAGDAIPWRAGVLLHAIDDLYAMPGYWAVRTRDFTYTEYTTGDQELYDLTGKVGSADPYQLTNRVGSAAYAGTRTTLRDLLSRLKAGEDPNETPAAVKVALTDSGFTPVSVTATQGRNVTWTNRSTATHNVTEAVGLGPAAAPLFASGGLARDAAYTYGFAWAATYNYKDTTTGRTARVAVPIRVSPASGTSATVFVLSFAPGAPPPGITFNVQIKRPGAPAFVNWESALTAASRSFSPDAGDGTYQFRARVRTSSGRASAWSPLRAVAVS